MFMSVAILLWVHNYTPDSCETTCRAIQGWTEGQRATSCIVWGSIGASLWKGINTPEVMDGAIIQQNTSSVTSKPTRLNTSITSKVIVVSSSFCTASFVLRGNKIHFGRKTSKRIQYIFCFWLLLFFVVVVLLRLWFNCENAMFLFPGEPSRIYYWYTFKTMKSKPLCFVAYFSYKRQTTGT